MIDIAGINPQGFPFTNAPFRPKQAGDGKRSFTASLASIGTVFTKAMCQEVEFKINRIVIIYDIDKESAFYYIFNKHASLK